MGWGGYQPKDGDGPHDWFSSLSREAVVPFLLRRFMKARRLGGNQCDWEVVGVLQLVWESHLDAPRALVKEGLACCERLLADEEWIESWREPSKHRRSLTLWRDLLQRALDRKMCGIVSRRRRQRGRVKLVPLDPISWYDVIDDVERAAKMMPLKPLRRVRGPKLKVTQLGGGRFRVERVKRRKLKNA